MTIPKYFFLFSLFFSLSLTAAEESKKPEIEQEDREALERPRFGKVYFIHQMPEKVLTLDSKSQTDKTKFAFMINRNKETSYLAVESVAKDSWQYAFFVDHKHIFKQDRSYTIEEFDLLFFDDGTYRIRCTHGEESFLAVMPVSPGSWQYAIFATEDYIAKNKCISHFKIVAQEGSSNKDFLIETVGENSSVLILNPVASASFQYPFFADFDYLNSSHGHSVIFDINTCR